MGSRRYSSRRCDSCGKQGARSLRYWAYRPMIANYGPWLIERLCDACVDDMRGSVVWNMRITYPARQMTLRGLRLGF